MRFLTYKELKLEIANKTLTQEEKDFYIECEENNKVDSRLSEEERQMSIEIYNLLIAY